MLNKTMIAITAAVIVGSASAAFSYDDVESRIGDKYPFLDQSSRSFTARNIGGSYVPARSVASLNQPLREDVEAHVGDKYPMLEPTAPSPSAANILRTRVEMRRAEASIWTTYADPESRIGDKYPLLDRANSLGAKVFTNTARLRQPKNRV